MRRDNRRRSFPPGPSAGPLRVILVCVNKKERKTRTANTTLTIKFLPESYQLRLVAERARIHTARSDLHHGWGQISEGDRRKAVFQERPPQGGFPPEVKPQPWSKY